MCEYNVFFKIKTRLFLQKNMLCPSKIFETNKVCVNSPERIIKPNGHGNLRKSDFAKISAFVVCYFAITCCPLNSIGDYINLSCYIMKTLSTRKTNRT